MKFVLAPPFFYEKNASLAALYNFTCFFSVGRVDDDVVFVQFKIESSLIGNGFHCQS